MNGWEWACWVGGAAAALTGLWLFYHSMLADRSRGRRRCPKCWYDMAGLAGMQCPECGREARKEGQLRRTRRRWRWGLAAVVMVGVGSGATYAPTAMRLGWPDAMPTWALAVAARYHDTGRRDAFEILRERYTRAKPARSTWIGRVALAWYGQYLVDTVPRTPASATALGWGFGRPTGDDLTGMEFLRCAGAEGRGSIDTLLRIWVDENGVLERGEWARAAAVGIATADGDRHGVMSRLLGPGMSREVRAGAAHGLSSAELDGAVAMRLIERVVMDKDPTISTVACGALTDRADLEKHRAEVRRIVDACNEADSTMIISDLKMPANGALMCELARHPNTVRRRTALGRLAGKGGVMAECTDWLLSVVVNDPDEMCRMNAVLAMGWNCLGSEKERGVVMIAAFHDTSPHVRAAAVEAAMVCTKSADADRIGLGALSDGSDYVRAATVRLLARFARDPAGALERVREIQKDESKEVRDAAARGVRDLRDRVAKAAAGTGH